MTRPHPETIPFVDLGRLHDGLTESILQVWREQIARSAFVGGPEVEAFEREFAAWVGSAACVGINSGTDALRLALTAGGVAVADGSPSATTAASSCAVSTSAPLTVT